MLIPRCRRGRLRARRTARPAGRREAVVRLRSLGVVAADLDARAIPDYSQLHSLGLLLPELPPRAVAHHLSSQALGLLFVELDGGQVSVTCWAELLVRVLTALQPQPEDGGGSRVEF